MCFSLSRKSFPASLKPQAQIELDRYHGEWVVTKNNGILPLSVASLGMDHCTKNQISVEGEFVEIH